MFKPHHDRCEVYINWGRATIRCSCSCHDFPPDFDPPIDPPPGVEENSLIGRIERLIGQKSFGVPIPGARELDPRHNGVREVVLIEDLRAILKEERSGNERA